MTREEAVKELEYIQSRMVEYAEGQTAIDMAIEALSADVETHDLHTDTHSVCLDLISRADAIEAIASRDETDGTVKVFTGRQVNEILTALPSARPTEWIPCEERLPDANECPMDCMVTRRSKFVGNYVDMAVAEKNGTWTHEDWKAITIDGNATCISTRDADIIAWMPLPEPYKEDNNA